MSERSSKQFPLRAHAGVENKTEKRNEAKNRNDTLADTATSLFDQKNDVRRFENVGAVPVASVLRVPSILYVRVQSVS